jgi:hypothetical protein
MYKIAQMRIKQDGCIPITMEYIIERNGMSNNLPSLIYSWSF